MYYKPHFIQNIFNSQIWGHLCSRLKLKSENSEHKTLKVLTNTLPKSLCLPLCCAPALPSKSLSAEEAAMHKHSMKHKYNIISTDCFLMKYFGNLHSNSQTSELSRIRTDFINIWQFPLTHRLLTLRFFAQTVNVWLICW